ncbi:hypothetical protein V2G26_017108 [Clonostachys chloroleuca]
MPSIRSRTRSAFRTSQHARNEKTVHEDRGLLHRIVRSAPLPGLQPLNAQTGVLHQNPDNCRVTASRDSCLGYFRSGASEMPGCRAGSRVIQPPMLCSAS